MESVFFTTDNSLTINYNHRKEKLIFAIKVKYVDVCIVETDEIDIFESIPLIPT